MDNIVCLSEVAEIDISSIDKKIKTHEQRVKLCNFTDIYYNWAIDKSKIHYLMDSTASDKNIERFTLKKGQVAITKDSETRDDIGMSAYIADDLEQTVLGYHCALITPDETKLNGKYLNAYLSSQMGRKYFANQASGSGQRYTLTKNAIESVGIYLPDIKSQEKIGNIFSSIDRKITNNNAITQQLEAMAKTIYDYWFLQFEFPNEEGKPYKSSGGKMVWSEELQREIPAGWRVKTLGNYADVRKGKLITEKEANLHGRYKVVSAGLDFSYYHDQFNREENTISISASGANAGFVKLWREKIFANDCTTVRKENVVETIYVFNYLKAIQSYLYRQARGSAQPHVYPKDIENLKLVIPTDSIMAKYAKKVVDNNAYIANLSAQNQKLQSLRDFLLPLLMNGQVSVE